ncbi:MAG TPA: universal stress protein [Devosiaceae bacterium]|jgi:nucleotide-binding universal stress UspA family protein|nr:universal stress protein [Devosiaceae bacterium]
MTDTSSSLDFILPISTVPDATPGEGLLSALNFAARTGGRVTGLVHEVDIPPISNAIAEAMLRVSALSAEVEADSRNRGERLAEQLRQHAAALGLPFASRSLKCRAEALPQQVAVAARTHDCALLVSDPQSTDRSALSEAVLFGSGGPVVFIPTHVADIPLDTMAIAWDGSRTAARAVRDAMPILRQAREVCICTFEEDKPDAARQLPELQRYLEGHGIASCHAAGSIGATTIGDAMQDVAQKQGAGLLVLGAYGHSRLQEIVLGGATRTVLQRLRMPVLMSH